MSTSNTIMKGRLFGDPYRAIDLWEFRRELTLVKRLINIAEKCVDAKETHSADTFEGVCFYIARSIIGYSKGAFDNLVLGYFDATEMIIRTIIENRVILDIIFNDEKQLLWKYYLVQSYRNSLIQTDRSISSSDRFNQLCEELEIAPEFLQPRGNRKPYIALNYGWTYMLDTIRPEKRFTFDGICDAAEGQRQNYQDFQWMSKSSHGTSYFEKVTHYTGTERIMSLFSSIYINLYLLITMYCDGIWGNDFDEVTDEIETIFYHFFEVYDQIYK